MYLLEAITVGLPFCIFKILTGLFYSQIWLTILGCLDAFFNIINILSLMLLKKRILPTCIVTFLIKFIKRPNPASKIKWEDLGNSLDVVLSFILVALMIGKNNLTQLPSNQLMYWNIAVIFNVLGAGLSRFTISLKNFAAHSS